MWSTDYHADRDWPDRMGNKEIVDSLHKWYNETSHAVRGISFNIKANECFGLLGVNGAGKTSTFEVLTGLQRASSGTATVSGIDCSAPATIGYCPQYDALIGDVSGRSSLIILAGMHGYRNPFTIADTVIECVDMAEHASRPSNTYSGGQRRKISVAAALLAQNSLVILDEPTAGIDPVARRDIWKVLCALRDATDTAILLTSHSMDECEALCSRIAFMRAGKFIALGTPQEMKSNHGGHFDLTVVVNAFAEVVTEAVKKFFPKAELKGAAFTQTFNFMIPRDRNHEWSKVWEYAEEISEDLKAIDVCLSQASLEDAFIEIAVESN